MKHFAIDFRFTEKRNLQALASIFSAEAAVKKYPELFSRLTQVLGQAQAINKRVYFFDYLDNTIGYILKKTGKIAGYVNDVHGIATVEFESNRKLTLNPVKKAWYWLKATLASRLDRKVFESGDSFLFGSHAMQEYFQSRYGIRGKCLVLPYLLDEKALTAKADPVKVPALKQRYGLAETDFVFMFVGTYKATAGVEDLLGAFKQLQAERRGVKLILIGDGMTRKYCENAARSLAAQGAVCFGDPVPYATLSDYFALANVIVCPDRDNPFSQFVVHIKYLDALASGKLVINGRFKSVAELNAGKPLSLLFTPSDPTSLYHALKDARELYRQHCDTYHFAREYAREHLTYSASVPSLVVLNASLNDAR